VIFAFPAAGPLPWLIALTSGALNEIHAVRDPSTLEWTIETYRAAPLPRPTFDKHDDSLVHFDDSVVKPLIDSTLLRSSLAKPAPWTTIIAAPVVGILSKKVELIAGTLTLIKHTLQGGVIWLETETVTKFVIEPWLETRPATHVSDVHFTWRALEPCKDNFTNEELKVPMLLPKAVIDTEPVIGTFLCLSDEIDGAKYVNAIDISVERESTSKRIDFWIPIPGVLMKVRRASEITETDGISVPPMLMETGAVLKPPKLTPPTNIRICAVVGDDKGNTETIKGWL
jgi:hypothetical protein